MDSCRERRHPGQRRRNDHPQDRRLQSRPGEAIRGAAPLRPAPLRPRQGGRRAYGLVGSAARMLWGGVRQPGRRARAQSAAIRARVGERRFLAETCNLPVSGGSSLSYMLWFRDEHPDVWAATVKFGHCNTYLVKRMTGRWAIDPSTTSITGLYNTTRNDLTWNQTVLGLAGIDEGMLPPLRQSHKPIGPIRPAIADELGLPRGCVVLCGGNDAVLAAFSGGLTEPGDINIISGTCDIASVCTDAPVSSPDFNVRCHAIPGRWLTFFVLNTGGAALDWFHASFCRELSDGQFYDEYVPGVLEAFLEDPGVDKREAELPTYEPYLGGSRYSLERLTAGFTGLTLETRPEQ